MSDRAVLFLGSLAAMLGALIVAIWLIASGEVGSFDGNFLLLSSLVVAAAFALYLRFLIRQASRTEPPRKVAPVIERKTAIEREPVGKI